MSKTLFDFAVEEVREKMKDLKRKKENQASTGISFFQGSRRFCKVLNGKKKLNVELNVTLPKEVQKQFPNLKTYSEQEAKKKHLGTMRHLISCNTEEEVRAIVEVAFQQFVKETKEEKSSSKSQNTSQRTKNSTQSNSKNPRSKAKRAKNTNSGSDGCFTRQLTTEDLERLSKYEKQGKLKVDPRVAKNQKKSGFIKPVQKPSYGILLPNGVQGGKKTIILPDGTEKEV